MQCPNCSRELEPDAVICAGCDYILDTSFLGDDITDDRPPDERSPAFGGDALILGDVTNDYAEVFSEETGSYLDAATGAETRALRRAPVYVDASTAQLTAPDAIVGRTDAPAPPLTPFEEHVLSFFDGQRTVQQAQDESGLGIEDLRIAVCMLHEKGLVGLRAQDYEDADETELEAKLPAALLAERGELPPSREAHDDGAIPPMPSAPPSEPGLSLDEPATVQTPSLRGEAEPPPTAVSAGGIAQERPKPRAPAPRGPPVSAVDRAKARGVYDLAMKDIQNGRLARARMYAKLASTLDPREETYKDLLANWDRVVTASSTSTGQGAAPTSLADLEKLPDDVRLFKEAEQAEAKGEFRKAVSLLREAIGKNPDEGALHNRLGVVLATRLKDFTGAMSALFAAVELEPDNANFKHNLAKVLAAAEGKRSVGDMDISELLTGTGEFDAKKAEAVGKGRKSGFAAFKRKLF